jgi:hypothetical protein
MRIQPLRAAAWWLVLTGWVAALIAPGAAAISAFTALPALGVEVPAYKAFFADDPDGAGRLAAGFVTAPIFLAADRIQLGLAGIAVLLVVVSRGIPCGNGGSINRLVSLDDWRAAALADDSTAAATAYQIFDPLHRAAERLMTATLASLLVLITACGLATGTNSRMARR